MNSINWMRTGLGTLAVLLFGASPLFGQVVINEFVYDAPGVIEDREFVELYNAGDSSADISEWKLQSTDLTDGFFFDDQIPASTMLAAGDYYVIGAAGVPNVDLVITPIGDELWPNAYGLFELLDDSSNLIDAAAYEVNKFFLLGGVPLSPAQIAQTGPSGNFANYRSNNTFPQSVARYQDGRDNNVNGRDFGVIPLTPGTSNNLTQNPNYTLPDVDGLTVGDDVPGFGASFVLPKVTDPTVVSGENPNAIPASPQGGNVITAWDSTGGGNMAASNEMATNFDISAYLDTGPLGETGNFVGEQTAYGIGTTGTFFNFGNPSATYGSNLGGNGNTGVGWFYERQDPNSGPDPDPENERGCPCEGLTDLHLIDFGAGGDSEPGGDWTIITTIDLSGEASGWHDLGIDIDDLGNVTATFDDQVINFSTSTDLLGTFYVGYREGLAGTPATLRPPTYDLIASVVEDNADFDDDGDIDGNDFLIWQRGVGIDDGSAQPGDGDANGDGNVNAADLGIWQGQFGDTSVNAVSAVPEPSSLLIVAIALMCLAGGDLCIAKNDRI